MQMCILLYYWADKKVMMKIKVKGIQQLATRLAATGTHMPYWIAQCYLPPGRTDIPDHTTQPKLVLD